MITCYVRVLHSSVNFFENAATEAVSLFFCSNKSFCYLFMDICLTEVLPPQKYIMYEISIDCLEFCGFSQNFLWKVAQM